MRIDEGYLMHDPAGWCVAAIRPAFPISAADRWSHGVPDHCRAYKPAWRLLRSA